MARFIPARDDYRRQALLMLSAGWTAIGLTYVAAPPTKGRAAGFAWLPDWASIGLLGWVWIIVPVVVGALSVIWPKRRRFERIAFGLLPIPPALWSVIFAGSWLLGTHPLGYASAVSYAIFAATVLMFARWPNPVAKEGND